MVETFELETEKKNIRVGKSQYLKDNIVFYGNDNKYPNILEALIDGSQTANICVNTFANFLSTGFVNKDLDTIEVGRTVTNKKYILKALVRDIAKSLAKFNGAYVAVTKDHENNVVNVCVLDFVKVRFSEFDDLGRSNYVYVGDWNNEIVGKRSKRKFNKFPLFNNNDDVYREQSRICGTTTQVYHIFANTSYIYPVNAFEAVCYDMDTEACIQETLHNEITQGSPSKIILRTDFSKDERKREQQMEQIKRFAGPNGDKVLVIKSDFDQDGNPRSGNYKVDIIPDNRDLSKYGEVSKLIANNIRKSVNIPGILCDYENATGINVSGEQLKVSVNYFNDLIAPYKSLISEALTEIFEKTTIKFPSKDFTLKQFEMTY